MIVTVKIKPWLKEFLICRYGNPVEASKLNVVGVAVAPLIEYTPKDYVPARIDTEEALDIEIPQKLAYNAPSSHFGNIYLSEENQKRFESTISVLFKEELFFYLDDKIRYESKTKQRSSNIKDCIHQFCMDNNVTYNKIQYENLKKMYYRYRNKHKKVKKLQYKTSLVSPLIFL